MSTPTNPSPAAASSPARAAGEARTQQRIRYWLTPAGCEANNGHRSDLDRRHCRVCGVQLGGAS